MKAKYFHAFNEPQLLDVVARNQDGTVDLARNGVVVVSGCPVADKGAHGCCVIEVDAPKNAGLASLKDEALRLDKRAEELETVVLAARDALANAKNAEEKAARQADVEAAIEAADAADKAAEAALKAVKEAAAAEKSKPAKK